MKERKRQYLNRYLGVRHFRAVLLGSTLLVWAGVTGAHSAPATPDLRPLQQLEAALTAVVDQVKPAVVSITVERRRRVSHPLLDELRRRFGDRLPPEIEESITRGSGMIFRQEGRRVYILTNSHVIQQAERVRVKLVDQFEVLEGKVIGDDPRTDLAIVVVESDRKLPTVLFGDSDNLRVGALVLAIGSPYDFEASVTLGVVSNKEQEIPDPGQRIPHFRQRHLIQTDAPINPGNSGGPLVNIRGEVVGVSMAIFTPSGGNIGIGFAIPINVAKRVIDELIEKGYVTYGYLGVRILDLHDLARQKDLALSDVQDFFGVQEGAYVEQVEPGTPASRAGIQPMDIIVEFGGQRIDSAGRLQDVVGATPPGTETTVVVVRDRERKALRLKVAPMPRELTGRPETRREPEDVLGIRVEELTSEKAAELSIKPRGVLVAEVTPGSLAARQDIRPGDVLLRARNDQGTYELNRVADYEQFLQDLRQTRLVAFELLRIREGRPQRGTAVIVLPEEQEEEK
ncbi:MAG TPA: PDZ domain-containing protein [Armatimonadetes bacterium]|nr:PDZ domain-containing protein [Armatimonadota bacterium]